jgi:Family of unknown function (DUF6232)
MAHGTNGRINVWAEDQKLWVGPGRCSYYDLRHVTYVRRERVAKGILKTVMIIVGLSALAAIFIRLLQYDYENYNSVVQHGGFEAPPSYPLFRAVIYAIVLAGVLTMLIVFLAKLVRKFWGITSHALIIDYAGSPIKILVSRDEAAVEDLVAKIGHAASIPQSVFNTTLMAHYDFRWAQGVQLGNQNFQGNSWGM